jgi:hypothetical protein
VCATAHAGATAVLPWVKKHKELKTPAVAHENVVGFDESMLSDLMKPDFKLAGTIYTQPSHVKVKSVARRRMWLIYVHQETGELLHSLEDMYEAIYQL